MKLPMRFLWLFTILFAAGCAGLDHPEPPPLPAGRNHPEPGWADMQV